MPIPITIMHGASKAAQDACDCACHGDSMPLWARIVAACFIAIFGILLMILICSEQR